MKLPALGTVLLGTGLEAAKVSETTCRNINDCGFLQASCDTNVGCFEYALQISDENPCYCTCNDGFVENDDAQTINGVSYDSTCKFETACDRHKETLTGGDCGVHAFCDESTGSAQCHCENGFVNWEDGVGCVRDNPCLGVTCSTSGSDCFDDNGEAKCICSDNTDAYVLTDGTWSESATGIFATDATDVTCRPSTGCIDVTCGDNQHCAFGKDSDDLPVNYCVCDRGFVSINDTSNKVDERVVYDGSVPDMVCENLDECSSHLFNSCKVGQRCLDSHGTYSCTCDRGYVTNPDDEEDCVCDGPDHLGDRCVRMPEFTTCDLTEATIFCHPKRISAHFPKCAFEDAKIPDLFLSADDSVTSASDNPARCQPFVNYDNDTVTFVIDDDLTGCGMAHEDNGTHLIYQNALHSEHKEHIGIIERTTETIVDFGCIFPETLVVSIEQGINVISSSVDVVLAEKKGSVTLKMDAYEDEFFQTPITVDSVLFTPAPFYIRVWLHEDSNFVVTLDRCWATADAAADSSPSFDFITGGCGDEGEIEDDDLEIISNGVNPISIFRINSFTWTDSPDSTVHLHCDVHLCDPTAEECQPTCGTGARRRRRTATDDPSNTTHRMSSGPIYIQRHL
ncbi:Oidioi.mRNA.OKI2018_I69.PAR.g12183.t3.cds [Oikopleura dioica]|uniref:Oidioi.mRNA.OKI2018_I69.PAR.g12183.t3.cds n=1 Tax=Oikopleura dioica TaxID=34765 RepID=A0ABN7S6I0_OIKDI|nr:Oidioi.mRNA.OKI2018_I69.PAR.g12183.t3.cds [Oikopleura dioica]